MTSSGFGESSSSVTGLMSNRRAHLSDDLRLAAEKRANESVQQARLSFVSHAMGVGMRTAKDLLHLSAAVTYKEEGDSTHAEQEALKLSVRGAGSDTVPKFAGGGSSDDSVVAAASPAATPSPTHHKLLRRFASSVKKESGDGAWLNTCNQSARAAGYLVEVLREKGRSNGGSVNRRQFQEALEELGLSMASRDSKALFRSLE